MTAHVHAEPMAQYAIDALETDKPWERWELRRPNNDCWESAIEHPRWVKSFEYRRKHVESPRTKTVYQWAVLFDRKSRWTLLQDLYGTKDEVFTVTGAGVCRARRLDYTALEVPV